MSLAVGTKRTEVQVFQQRVMAWSVAKRHLPEDVALVEIVSRDSRIGWLDQQQPIHRRQSKPRRVVIQKIATRWNSGYGFHADRNRH